MDNILPCITISASNPSDVSAGSLYSSTQDDPKNPHANRNMSMGNVLFGQIRFMDINVYLWFVYRFKTMLIGADT